MAKRCPASRPLGPARLPRHEFFIMSDGFASVRRAPQAAVHGLLWDLALADVPALDDFEEVAAGLYDKRVQPVIRPVGAVQALVYVGRSTQDGKPRPGYVDTIVAAGEAANLPLAYLRSLTAILRRGTRGAPFVNGPEPAHDGPAPGVRARFATPFDRR